MDIYKQKYEQALSQAEKELKCCGSLDCDAARQIFRLFPELKESEDERIRKSIIRLIQRGGYMSPEDKDKAYAWLEKQNKQNPIWSEKEKARIDRIINVLDWAEEKGRISYSDWEDYVTYVKSLKPQSSQKPVWSEEDEHCIELLLPIIDSSSLIPKNRKKCKNFLKSLKDRYIWKPSEEQMKALNYVINLMASSESPTENDYYYNVFKDMRTHLKKLSEE